MILTRLSLPRFVLGTIGLGLGVLALGCGRPATEEECLEILRKSAELELLARLDNDRAAVDKELEAIENAMRPAMMERCVGKRISEGALKCVRSATTADEIISVCLR
ncbi:MAG: hypothetical protein B6A08_18305 [Sorangiineae bacterium NIC37A_2]|jgi:hypothetical protein|nr:MAG: hypothetical protein B6A08_18305 [Sorangiineae bacterium NIC37A_2]